MRRIAFAFAVIWLVAEPCEMVHAQGTRVRRQRRGRHSDDLATRMRRNRLNIDATQKVFGLWTRPEHLRQLSDNPRPTHGLITPVRDSRSPMYLLLKQRNLLNARSPMAIRLGSQNGRRDYILENGRWRGAVLPDPSPVTANRQPRPPGAPTSYPEMLINRLSQRADRYFASGLEQFRAAQAEYEKPAREQKAENIGVALLKSQHYFELVREIERDTARGFLADVMVSFERKDYSRAILNLFLALDRVETVDDLSLKWQDFYMTELRFQRVMDDVVFFTSSQPESAAANAILAYYSYLNGDIQTAITASNKAAKLLEEDVGELDQLRGERLSRSNRAPAAARLRDLLTEVQDAKSAASG